MFYVLYSSCMYLPYQIFIFYKFYMLHALLNPAMLSFQSIINVSAMEGKFYRHKMPTHPHTNMAKAALNMMTRTCADELSKQRIYMNSVDTGEGGATDLLFNWSLSHAV